MYKKQTKAQNAYISRLLNEGVDNYTEADEVKDSNQTALDKLKYQFEKLARFKNRSNVTCLNCGKKNIVKFNAGTATGGDYICHSCRLVSGGFSRREPAKVADDINATKPKH